MQPKGSFTPQHIHEFTRVVFFFYNVLACILHVLHLCFCFFFALQCLTFVHICVHLNAFRWTEKNISTRRTFI